MIERGPTAAPPGATVCPSARYAVVTEVPNIRGVSTRVLHEAT